MKHSRDAQVVDPAEAYVMTSLMESVFDKGGTAQPSIGDYSSGLSQARQVQRRPMPGSSATRLSSPPPYGSAMTRDRKLTSAEAYRAAPIFAAYTEKALTSVPPKIFPIPDGVVMSISIRRAASLLPTLVRVNGWNHSSAASQPTEVCGEHADLPCQPELRETSNPTHGGSNSSVGGQINPLKSIGLRILKPTLADQPLGRRPFSADYRSVIHASAVCLFIKH